MRCAYCGMVVHVGINVQVESGDTFSFCGPECVLRFELMGPAARLRGHVMARRAALVDDLEAERGSRVLTIIHRQEAWAAPLEDTYLTIEDSEAVVAGIRGTPEKKPIDLIVHTPGGVALAAELIAMALANHPGADDGHRAILRDVRRNPHRSGG